MPFRSISEFIEEKPPISLPADLSVRDAAKVMAEHHIGAVLVVQANELMGIFTERDLVNRVVARGLNPEITLLIQVMTRAPETVAPDQVLADALDIMIEKGFRHLPVVDRGKIAGVLSMRDIPLQYRLMRNNWIAAKAGMDRNLGGVGS